MNNLSFDSFIQKSQDFLSAKINSSSFNLDDAQSFGIIRQPYVLSGKSYQIYNFKYLTGYKPNKARPESVPYVFFILRPLGGIKEKFLEELNKKNSSQSYDSSIIGDYYTPFVPSFIEFKTLTDNLAGMLDNDYFPNKGYKFGFHLSVPTKDYDIALVFLELNSLKKLQEIYPEGIPFDPV